MRTHQESHPDAGDGRPMPLVEGDEEAFFLALLAKFPEAARRAEQPDEAEWQPPTP